MTRTRLLSTAAAMVLIGTGAAAAQTMKKDEAPARAPAAQQKAPAEKISPAMKAGESNAQTHKAPETTGQAPKELTPGHGQNVEPHAGINKPSDAADKSRQEGAATKHAPGAGGSADMKAKDAAEGSTGAKNSHTSATSEQKSTTGQGAAAATAKLSTEQRSKITTIIKQKKVEPARLNVSVSVGTRVPASVHFYPLPVEVVTIYPEWRGYDYILVGDEILIIDPGTHEIVAILEA